MRTLFRNIQLILTLSGSLLALGSCREMENPAERMRTEVQFVASRYATKSGLSSHEESVHSLDVLAFRSDNGRLDAYGRRSGSSSVSASLSVGTTVHYYVIANAPEHSLDGFTSEEDFLSSKLLLAQSPLDGFIMKGAGTIVVARDNEPVVVSLDRYVSKVSLRSLSVRYMDEFDDNPSVSVGRVALVNAVGDIPWSGTPSAGSVWYNAMGVDSSLGSPLGELLVWDGPVSILSSSPVELGVSLYTFPNPTDNAVNSLTNPVWSVRDSRLAVELVIDGESNWYPVDLPAMRCNRHYVVNELIINGPGAVGPDYPVLRSDISFSVSVSEWDEEDVDVDFGNV